METYTKDWRKYANGDGTSSVVTGSYQLLTWYDNYENLGTDDLVVINLK